MAFDSTSKNPVTYFVQAEQGGPVKIGRTSSAASMPTRLSSIQTGHPFKLRVLKTIDGDHEARLHTEFAAYRLNGEWFRPAPDLASLCGAKQDTVDHLTYENGYMDGWRDCMAFLGSQGVSIPSGFHYLIFAERHAKEATENGGQRIY